MACWNFWVTIMWSFNANCSWVTFTMMRNNIAFAVVGTNLASEPSQCLDSIQKQDIPEACSVTVYYVDSEGKLSPPDPGKTSPIDFTPIVRDSDGVDDIARDVLAISKEISEEHEWVWMINANDRLYSRFSLMDAIKSIDLAAVQLEAITSIHFGEAQQSMGTKKQHKGKLSALCNKYGFSQILGRGDCNLVRSYVFKTAFGEHFERALSQAANSDLDRFWLVSKYFYLANFDEKAVFFDAQIVSRGKALPLWFAADDSEAEIEGKYCFKLVDEFKELSVARGDDVKFSAPFFRTDQTILWQHLIRCQELFFKRMGDETEETTISENFAIFLENWERINDIAGILDNERLAERITSLVAAAALYSAKIMSGSHEDKDRLGNLFESERQAEPMFPSTILSV